MPFLAPPARDPYGVSTAQRRRFVLISPAALRAKLFPATTGVGAERPKAYHVSPGAETVVSFHGVRPPIGGSLVGEDIPGASGGGPAWWKHSEARRPGSHRAALSFHEDFVAGWRPVTFTRYNHPMLGAR